jgi:hypothetical protein
LIGSSTLPLFALSFERAGSAPFAILAPAAFPQSGLGSVCSAVCCHVSYLVHWIVGREYGSPRVTAGGIRGDLPNVNRLGGLTRKFFHSTRLSHLNSNNSQPCPPFHSTRTTTPTLSMLRQQRGALDRPLELCPPSGPRLLLQHVQPRLRVLGEVKKGLE